MQDTVIRLFRRIESCMQSEGELRFSIFLYEIICQFTFQKDSHENFCNSIEEYDPQTNKWREMGKLKCK